MVRVKYSVMVGMVLGLVCSYIHQYSGTLSVGVQTEIFLNNTELNVFTT